MRKVLTILLLFAGLAIQAQTTYHVSVDSIISTIAQVNALSLDPGDSALFHRGETWRETLTVPSSGSVGSYITFGAYGTGDKPKILGSTEVTTWIDSVMPGEAANNDLLTESFEGAGYEHTWSEAVGANTGCVVDEDSTAVLYPITGDGTQRLKLVKVISPTATALASKAFTQTNISAGDNPIAYIDFYVLINAHGLASSGNKVNIFRSRDSSGANSLDVGLQNYSGNIRLYVAANTGTTGGWLSASYPSTGSITLDQWYHVQLMYDITNHVYSGSIDGISLIGGSLTDGHSTGVKTLYVGDYENVFAATMYMDLVNISSTNFYSETIALPNNVWASDNIITDPYTLQYGDGNIYFKETNADITWGNVKKADSTYLAVEYDWTVFLNHILIYSINDPNTKYAGVEVSQRLDGINLNDKNYLVFDGLELAYGYSAGISDKWRPTALTGLVIKNCSIHHIGIKTLGYGIFTWHSNTLIQDNIIHDSGRRNISINSQDANLTFTVSNIIIENNVLYRGFHTTGVDVINGGTAVTFDGIIIRKNLIYDDLTETLDGVESYNCGQIYIQNSTGVSIVNVSIYSNIFKNSTGSTIKYSNASGYIYNNTFWGVNPNVVTADNASHIWIEDRSNVDIKNNIVYNNAVDAVATNYACLVIISDAGTCTSDYNLFYNTDAAENLVSWKGTSYITSQWATYKSAKSQDAHSPNPADPLLTSDYHLQSGSPAINAGTDVGLTTDYSGHKIPYNLIQDIGAYEWGRRYLKDENGKFVKSIDGKFIIVEL